MPNTKRRVDKSQNKRIAKLERQFPTVRQVINNQNSLLYTDTVQSRVYDLLPSSNNTEKVDLRGYRFRFVSTKDPPDNSVVRFRYIMFIYKCTADYSGAATYIQPTVDDILNDNTDKTLANYNPDNTSRLRVLYDRTYVSDQMVTNHQGSHSKTYKKAIQFMPLIDKAFVLRPFLLVVSADTTATNKVTLAQDVDLMVNQMP